MDKSNFISWENIYYTIMYHVNMACFCVYSSEVYSAKNGNMHSANFDTYF